MSKPLQLEGKRFGRLSVLSRSDKKDSIGSKSYWNCVCDCGTERVVHRANLTSGRTLSCGCLHHERAVEAGTTHGDYGSRLHGIWTNMLSRCRNRNAGGYHRYGGRGISVCEEWLNYENFHKWAVNNGYRDNLTIERKDNDGNYCPENCRWATRKEQSNNTRRTVRLCFNGETRSLGEWSEITGIPRDVIYRRIRHRNWSIEKALSTPTLPTNRRKTT